MVRLSDIPVAALAGTIGVTGLLGLRWMVRRRTEAWWRDAHPVGPSGIIPGAETIAIDGGARAALLLHGFGDAPSTVALIARSLGVRGWTVRAPLLAGHGRTLEAFSRARRAEWMRDAHDAYRELRDTHQSVAIVGASMGGALAISLAAVQPPAALVLLTPYLALPISAQLLTSLWPLWQLRRPYVAGDPVASIADPLARAQSLGYGRASPRSLLELRRVVEAAQRDSAAVVAPTLAVFSRHDYRIPVYAAERAFQKIGAREKSLRWVERSGHVITVDYDRDEVTRLTVDWLERHLPDPSTAA